MISRSSTTRAIVSGTGSLRVRGGLARVQQLAGAAPELHDLAERGAEQLVHVRDDLDISLISGIDADASKQALASGLISLAESAGATILGEGIEREEELETLVGLGVEFGQGYLL